MTERETILAVLQSDIALAGLILIFSGFLLFKADSYTNVRIGDKYRMLARCGMVPVLAALSSSWICIDAIAGSQWEAAHALVSLRVVVVLTSLYVLLSAYMCFR